MTGGAKPSPSPRDPRGRKVAAHHDPIIKRRFYCASNDGCLAWLSKDGKYKLVEFQFFGQAQNIGRRLQNILGIPHGVVSQDYQLSEEEAEREREHIRASHRQSYRKCNQLKKES